MKRLFSVLFTICSSLIAFSQLDGSKSFSIKPLEIKPSTTPSITPAPSIFDKSDKEEKPSISLEKQPSFTMTKEEFKNPGDKYVKKLNDKLKSEEREVLPEYSRNQYFGDYRVSGKKAKIMYRDHEYPDGDRIRVYINDSIVQYDVTLEENFKGFKIELAAGFNKIEFEALNQGTSGPNTAQFVVYDDKDNLISSKEWLLTTGFKASVILIKE
jgi:hypothetical protein